MKFRVAAVLGFAAVVPLAFAADPFAENVRTTPHLKPEEEQKTFKLPPGFEIQLVAAEPEIMKPMNFAFDAKGRIWVSDTREYPYPVPLDKTGRDTIKILEDFDENGRARKVTTFVDELNIPNGIYPYKNGVIAWSIPNIWYFQDTDGDGKADKREVLVGPFGWERDTHGNQSSFRRGFDGWLYATHGYNNQSTVRGRDGSTISMQSGNTYRISLDGQTVQHHTFGQVNPFGLCFDPAGNMYSADCHSAPVYELLRGAYYPSFGKPHDGLGFGPTLIEHSHGSTAIAGILFYADDKWPAEYQNNTFIGNVMTSRVNRDTLLPRGSSKTAREEADFVTTTDPWFRPVDVKLGPDGAMYIADFYNRIIGHYEVPLNHPGRDRLSGRIWRVVYKENFKPGLALNTSSVDSLLDEFKSANLPRRMLAMNELLDRYGDQAATALQARLHLNSTPFELVHFSWALHRLGKLDQTSLRQLARHQDKTVRAHFMRILSETPNWNDTDRALALGGLDDTDPLVQRCAADALGQHPDPSHIQPLLALRQVVPAQDDHLLHTVRMALRNQLRDEKAFAAIKDLSISSRDRQALADVAVAVPTSAAAVFLANYLPQSNEPAAQTANYVRHASRYLPAEELPTLTRFIRARFRNDVDQQLGFFRAVQEGSAQRGAQLTPDVKEWGTELAGKLLDAASGENQPWVNFQVPSKPTANPYFLQKRASSDGDKDSTFICSLPPGGEQLTGHLRSREFEIPARLKFYMAGHDGIPTSPPDKLNRLELKEAGTGKTLMVAAPPRNDLAQPYDWDLSAHAGKKGYLELIDEHTGSGYAWLALGRLSPSVVPMPSASPNATAERVKAASALTQQLGAKSLETKLAELLADESVEFDARAALASALVSFNPAESRAALAVVVSEPTLPMEFRHRAAQTIATGSQNDALSLLVEAMRLASARVQARLAQSLAGNASGTEILLAMIDRGEASPRVLLDSVVKNKLSALREGAFSPRIEKITKDLAPADEVAQKAIEHWRKAYNPAKAEPVTGAQVYVKNCSVCHQIDGNGAVVGPQLDGIGNSGLERILEDILDPNRNVDVNFRTHIILLKDGDVVTGLPRREEGETIILADSTGKEVRVAKSEIEKRRESDTSLMPGNFGDVITPEDFQHLLAFLLSKGATGQ